MKRRQLVRHLEQRGCQLFREGGKHSVYFNPANNKTSTLPRHSEVSERIARKVCRDLGISEP